MPIRALRDNVFVRRRKAGERVGLLFIPESAREKTQEGVVVAAGAGARLKGHVIRPMSVKPGDRVLFGKYPGEPAEIDGELLVNIKEDDLFAVVEPDGTVRPLYDHVAIKRSATPESHDGLIYIPHTSQELAYEGDVVAAGPGICNYKNGSWLSLSVKPGDHVLFGTKYAGQEVKVGAETLLLMRQAELAAVLE